MGLIKKYIILLILIIAIVFFIIFLGMRVKLYNDYVNLREKIEPFTEAMAHHGTLHYEGELPADAIVFDEHLYFSVDEAYHLTQNMEDIMEYRYKNEIKAIDIHVAGVPVNNHFVKEISAKTGLEEERVKLILAPFKFTNDIDALLYAIQQDTQQKLSLTSSKDKIQEAMVLNGTILQYLQNFFALGPDGETVNIITGNVDGLELMDGTIQITNGQHTYFITFVGDYTDEEIEQFMETVHIQ